MLTLLACVDPVASEVGITDVVVSASALLPNVLTLSWSTTTPTNGQVEWSDALGDHVVASEDTSSSAHSVLVPGLPVDGTVTLRAAGVDEQGERQISADIVQTFEGPALPAVEVLTPSLGEGYVLMNVGDSTSWTVMIVDLAGRPVWYDLPDPDSLSTASSLSLDGTAVLYAEYPKEMLDQTGGVTRMALDGSARTTVDTPGLHHDFAELPDGSIAWLTTEVQDWEGNPTMGDEIRVTAVDGTTYTAFSAWDQLVPYAMCSHYAPVRYASESWDWVHANSLRYDASTSTYLMMSRNLDALFGIDTSGTIQWQLGGADSDYSFVGDPGFDHAHYTDIWAGGLVVFDNGLHTEPPRSRVVAYAIDESSRTVTPTWQVESDTFIENLGDARRLADGTFLVAWSTEGRVSQLDEDGAVLWEVALPEDYRVGHVTFLEAL